MPNSSKPKKNHTPRPIRPSIGATQPKTQNDNPYRLRIQWLQPDGPGTRIGGTVARLPGDTPELFGRMLADIARLAARSFGQTEADLPGLQQEIMAAFDHEIENPSCDERGARSA